MWHTRDADTHILGYYICICMCVVLFRQFGYLREGKFLSLKVNWLLLIKMEIKILRIAQTQKIRKITSSCLQARKMAEKAMQWPVEVYTQYIMLHCLLLFIPLFMLLPSNYAFIASYVWKMQIYRYNHALHPHWAPLDGTVNAYCWLCPLHWRCRVYQFLTSIFILTFSFLIRSLFELSVWQNFA